MKTQSLGWRCDVARSVQLWGRRFDNVEQSRSQHSVRQRWRNSAAGSAHLERDPVNRSSAPHAHASHARLAAARRALLPASRRLRVRVALRCASTFRGGRNYYFL